MVTRSRAGWSCATAMAGAGVAAAIPTRASSVVKFAMAASTTWTFRVCGKPLERFAIYRPAGASAPAGRARESVVEGKRVRGRGDSGGRRNNKKKKETINHAETQDYAP